MIEVAHLSKRYPGRAAVDDISFSVKAGEIVGFLGPNGAGKSTTMRMLAGYLPPTSGSARVAGFDVLSQSLEVRRRIGYLPENCPLYPEMRVDEYLEFRAGIKGVPARRIRPRVEEVKALCDIGDMGRRIIGQLSKGYRQRVGLADSFVHDPELLILDEPTIGLDPHQIRHVRSLVIELSKRHTILLSTHILSEIEMSCHRVLILHRGRVIAAESPEQLRHRLAGREQVVAELRGPREAVEPGLRALDGVAAVSVDAAGDWLRCSISAQADVREAVAALAQRSGWALRELHRERQSLEDVFVALTAGGKEPGP